MRSGTSFSKPVGLFYPTLWKKNMVRFWPIWAFYGVCWLFAMPLNLLMGSGGAVNSESYARYFADAQVLEMSTYGSITAAVVFGLLSAVAVFSYLCNGRSVGLFHALPVRREGLFLTNCLSGLSFMLLPTLAVFLLTVLVELALGALNLGALCMWLAVQVLLTLFFFSFAVFCAMFTGHILALPAFYGILNVLTISMMYLVDSVLRAFVYGYDSVELMERVSTWLSPVFHLGGRLWVDEQWMETAAGQELERVVFHGLGYAILYALIGAGLLLAALLLYRRRDLEGAGDVITVRWVRPVFKYGVAFCAALSGGLMLYAFFIGGLSESAWSLLCFMIISGCVGYFAAEMLLQKSFRVFGRSWKGCVVFAVALAVLTAGMELDVTGFERRVPANPASAELWGVDSAPYDSGNRTFMDPTDPEFAHAVVELHQAIVAERALHENENWARSTQTRLLSRGGLPVEIQTEGTTYCYLDYTLPSGGRMSRRYEIRTTEEDLKNPDSAASRLQAILNRPEVVMKSYFEQVEERGMQLASISLKLLDTETETYDHYPVPTAWRDRLMEAVRADMEAGRLGRRYLLEDEDRLQNCMYNDLELDYSRSTPDGRESYTVAITLQSTATETLQVLRQAGVVDDTHVLQTMAQIRQEEALREGEDKEIRAAAVG